jgi:hypothetical protein
MLMILAAVGILGLMSCSTNEVLMVRPWFPVYTTLELQSLNSRAPVGQLVGVAGTITSVNVSTSTVVLDKIVLCKLSAAEGEPLQRLLSSYAGNVGAAAAIRGRLIRGPSQSGVLFTLSPSGPSILEVADARRKLEQERASRPGLRFAKYYGWTEAP